jgi:hypothetical protein
MTMVIKSFVNYNPIAIESLPGIGDTLLCSARKKSSEMNSSLAQETRSSGFGVCNMLAARFPYQPPNSFGRQWRQKSPPYRRASMAGRTGFEPAAEFNPSNCLAGSPIRPLWHLPIEICSPRRGKFYHRWGQDANRITACVVLPAKRAGGNIVASRRSGKPAIRIADPFECKLAWHGPAKRRLPCSTCSAFLRSDDRIGQG